MPGLCANTLLVNGYSVPSLVLDIKDTGWIRSSSACQGTNGLVLNTDMKINNAALRWEWWWDQTQDTGLLSCVWLLRSHGLLPPRLLCPWNSPGKNTGVGCHFLLQGKESIRDAIEPEGYTFCSKKLPARLQEVVGAPKGSSKLTKGMIILAWEIPWTEEPGRLQSMGSQSCTWLNG